jgi:hypothetical protein
MLPRVWTSALGSYYPHEASTSTPTRYLFVSDETSGEVRARRAQEAREARIASPTFNDDLSAKLNSGQMTIAEIKEALGDVAAVNPRYVDPDRFHEDPR